MLFYTLCSLAAHALLASAFTPGFPYSSEKVRGVNLGGWLVLEPWITPSLFDNTGNSAIVDEYTFGKYQSHSTALSTLTQHWNTWITESDFEAIAAAGLNHVRIPIGFWAWDVSGGEPYVQGQLPYLQKAITWAGNHNLNVIVDLHGAPGSQNGFDNSGLRGDPAWQNDQTNVDRTNAIIKKIADMVKDNSNVVPIIAPLNEPAGFYSQDLLDTARQYWYDSYGNIRYPYGSSQQSNTVVLLHDAFQPLSYWNGFMADKSNWQGVAMDTHIYQMFSQDLVSQSYQQHINTVCNNVDFQSSFDLWLIVGEWTPAQTDCAKYLNGRGVGARYDGSKSGSTRVGSCNGLTGKGSSFSSGFKTFLRQYWEAQVQTYERAQGWIQWTWKAENADEWTYQAGLQYGWIPKNPTDYKYPGICN